MKYWKTFFEKYLHIIYKTNGFHFIFYKPTKLDQGRFLKILFKINHLKKVQIR